MKKAINFLWTVYLYSIPVLLILSIVFVNSFGKYYLQIALLMLFIAGIASWISNTRKICDIFGHDWERVSLDTDYNKKKNIIEIVEKYKCKTCGKTKINKHIDAVK